MAEDTEGMPRGRIIDVQGQLAIWLMQALFVRVCMRVGLMCVGGGRSRLHRTNRIIIKKLLSDLILLADSQV